MELKNGKIEFLGHSGFLITLENGRKIAIDPYNVATNEKADLILVTHNHYDHCSIKDLEKMSREGTTIIIPADAQSKITHVEKIVMEIMEPGEQIEWNDVKIETVPAYNMNKKFHPKSEKWLGYVVKFDDVIIYHAGDTDKIPEMDKLTGYGKKGKEFVALFPVSGTYVMDAHEAADAASLISPDIAIPMHYGAGVVGTIEDAQRFVELCAAKNVNAKALEKI